MNGIYLAVPVLLPILGGILLLGLRGMVKGERRERRMMIAVEILVTANTLIVWALIMAMLRGGLSGRWVLFRMFSDLTVMFRLDRMGSVFAGLASFLWPLATLYAFEYMEHEDRKATFFAYYTMTYGVTMGIALAGNLVTLYFFYEMLTLVTFPLVLYPMTREAVRASRRYLYYSIGGAAFAFLGLVFVLGFSSTGNTGFVPGGVLDPLRAAEKKDVLLLIYVLAFFGFGVKAALLPCHGWLPKATVAPTPVTALLHAVAVVKSGAFAILRFTYFSYGASFLRGTWAQAVVMTAALMTIAFGSTMAVREVHWKRRLAYSTISNLSYILFGAAMMSPVGLAAALSHLVAHAFMKICSFFCAGAVMHRAGKTHVYELDGLGRTMPVTFGCLTVASLSLMGIPLFAGFISKWNLGQAAFASGVWLGDGGIAWAWLPYVGVGVILYSALMTGIYMLTVLVRAYFPKMAENVGEGGQRTADGFRAAGGCGTVGGFGPAGGCGTAGGFLAADECETASDTRDPGWMMLAPLVIFAAIILAIGLHSAPLMAYLTAIGGEVG